MEKGTCWQPLVKNTIVFIARETLIADGYNNWKTHPFTNVDSFFSSITLMFYIFLAKKELTVSYSDISLNNCYICVTK